MLYPGTVLTQERMLFFFFYLSCLIVFFLRISKLVIVISSLRCCSTFLLIKLIFLYYLNMVLNSKRHNLQGTGWGLMKIQFTTNNCKIILYYVPFPFSTSIFFFFFALGNLCQSTIPICFCFCSCSIHVVGYSLFLPAYLVFIKNSLLWMLNSPGLQSSLSVP